MSSNGNQNEGSKQSDFDQKILLKNESIRQLREKIAAKRQATAKRAAFQLRQLTLLKNSATRMSNLAKLLERVAQQQKEAKTKKIDILKRQLEHYEEKSIFYCSDSD